MAADLLRGLSPAQVDVVTSDAAPLAVVAGPGSGKTRVLTRRVAWRCRAGEVDPAHVLVLTFSRRAATELLDRLGRLGLPDAGRQAGVTAGTFHSVAWSEIARHRAERHQPAPAILGRPGRLLAPALAAVLGREPWRSEVAATVAELGWARRQGGDADRYPGLVRGSARQPPLPPEVVAEAWRGYERAKRSRRVLDLDDLLGECTRLLSEDAEAAAAARWRYRHVFVDEYQDLNPSHIRLLQAWVGGRPDVCLVGDPDQAVYGFNGASPDLFDRVSSDWPGVRILTLPENFRSTPEVVALAEAVRPTPAGAAPATVCRADHPDSCIAGSPEPGRSRQPPGLLPSIAAHTDDRAE
ncbi:MAG TPA: ATP-dependent helicase, partial [Acidimicrobiales bacterium]